LAALGEGISNYYPSLNMQRAIKDLRLPNTYVQTKQHCGIYYILKEESSKANDPSYGLNFFFVGI